MHTVYLNICQLRKLAFKIIHSTTLLLPAWKSCLEAAKLAIRIMPRDVTTRWNSTYDMLLFAVEHKKVLEKLTSNLGNGLWAYELTSEEWNIATELRDTLKVSAMLHCHKSSYDYLSTFQILKDATEYFSRGSPNLPSVIPGMDHIDTTFTKLLHNTKTHAAIWASISTAKRTLNRYYSRMDEVEVYRIAMGNIFTVLVLIFYWST